MDTYAKIAFSSFTPQKVAEAPTFAYCRIFFQPRMGRRFDRSMAKSDTPLTAPLNPVMFADQMSDFVFPTYS
jgi:hypothetical protein